MKLSENQAELLKETFNMGIGNAANIVSQMVQREVVLSVPIVKLEKLSVIIDDTKSEHGQSVVGVYQKCHGGMNGTALMIYPQGASLELISFLLGSKSNVEKIAELESGALKEFGNIVLTTCLEELGKIFGKNIQTDFPEIILGDIKKVFSINKHLDLDNYIINLKISFEVVGSENCGKIFLNIDPQKIFNLEQVLDDYYDKLIGRSS